MRIVIEIADEFLRSQAEGAGIRYWCSLCEWDDEGPHPIALPIAVTIAIDPQDSDSGKRFLLNWMRAVELAVSQYPRILDPKQQDTETGDMWIQLAAFGEIRYG